MLDPIYAIVDADIAGRHGYTVPALARLYLDAGIRFLQIRAKQATGAELLAWADAVADAAAPHGATVIVNDRFDIALMAGLAGVHVGQDDVAPGRVRAAAGPRLWVGYSTHTREQVDAAVELPLTYVAVGPVFGTQTKATGYDAVGLDLVRYAAQRAAGRMPVVAIGGITLERAASVLDAGAASVAVITDLLAGDGPGERVRQYRDVLKR